MIAFVFPGQGAQRLRMGKALAELSEEARATWAEAERVLGLSLSHIHWASSSPELRRRTDYLQPSLLTASIAILRYLETATNRPTLDLAESPLVPDVVAGHSLGEYSALVAAGIMGFTDALRVVSARGTLMRRACEQSAGGMVAVHGLSAAQTRELCDEAARSEVLVPSAFNHPEETVVSGHDQALQRLASLVEKRGGSLRRLDVDGPFHCELMRPAAEDFAQALDRVEWHRPRVPIVQNTTADCVDDIDTIKRELVEQLVAPVQWQRSVQRFVAMGATEVFEIGPASPLSGSMKKCDPRLAVGAITDWLDGQRLASRAHFELKPFCKGYRGQVFRTDAGGRSKLSEDGAWQLLPGGAERRRQSEVHESRPALHG